jgi:hypothetical protein
MAKGRADLELMEAAVDISEGTLDKLELQKVPECKLSEQSRTCIRL